MAYMPRVAPGGVALFHDEFPFGCPGAGRDGTLRRSGGR